MIYIHQLSLDSIIHMLEVILRICRRSKWVFDLSFLVDISVMGILKDLCYIFYSIVDFFIEMVKYLYLTFFAFYGYSKIRLVEDSCRF